MHKARTHEPNRDERQRPADAPAKDSREIPRPVAEGLQCLRESAVPFALLHADTVGLDALPYLELNIDPSEHKIAFAGLRRAGYREMSAGLRFAKARVFLRYENERFFALVVRSEFEHAGIRYMDARLARSRIDKQQALPLLGAEDRFLHVLISSLLARRELTETEKVALRRLRRARLDMARLRQQTSPFGLSKEAERMVQDLELYLWNRKQWNRLAGRVRRALLRIPENKRGWRRHWRADRLRWSLRPVVLAIVGPMGSGCTTFAKALEEQLERSPLNATRVQMGCWNGTSLLARLLRRLAPVDIAWGRLFRAVRKRPTRLSQAERHYLTSTRPGLLGLVIRASWHGTRRLVYHALLCAMLWLRYFRCVARSRTAVVVADGWIYDLGFPPQKTPHARAVHLRRWIHLHFPMPDGILYASTAYKQAASHSPQLEREPYEAAHRGLRRLLAPQGPLELVADGAPEQMAKTFLRRYWAHLLQRHNSHH
jgi:hypothetical protein